ncbi:hypothetical protein GCM10018782_12250 [Streptomyces griseoaurantiacus]|nr:hypothetical protein GCM10018782_12250 [Streptomyces griseoaurantiacus]
MILVGDGGVREDDGARRSCPGNIFPGPYPKEYGGTPSRPRERARLPHWPRGVPRSMHEPPPPAQRSLPLTGVTTSASHRLHSTFPDIERVSDASTGNGTRSSQ